MASYIAKQLFINCFKQQCIRSGWKSAETNYNVINLLFLNQKAMLHSRHSSVFYRQLYAQPTIRTSAIEIFGSQASINNNSKCLRFSSSKVPKEAENDKQDQNVTKDKEVNSENSTLSKENQPEPEKLTLTARFKKMFKQYWYVLLPVHVCTSCLWFGGLYYLSSSGVDIPALLEQLSFSESVITKVKNSSMGHIAIAYMLYKILTPIRYTVTLGGTTVSIKYLSQWGYIRPVPSKEKLKQMYDDRKAKLKQKMK